MRLEGFTFAATHLVRSPPRGHHHPSSSRRVSDCHPVAPPPPAGVTFMEPAGFDENCITPPPVLRAENYSPCCASPTPHYLTPRRVYDYFPVSRNHCCCAVKPRYSAATTVRDYRAATGHKRMARSSRSQFTAPTWT